MHRFAWLIVAVMVAACLMPFGSAGIAKDIDVPPIANNADAKKQCTQICKAAGGKWDGKWSPAEGRATSSCSCDMPKPDKGPRKVNIKTGQIGSDKQAEEMCPIVCKGDNRTWQGEWKKTDEGRGAACTCYRK